MHPQWTRLHARWARPGDATEDLALATRLEEIDGEMTLLLVPGESAPTPSDAWIPFTLRHAHPAAPAPDPGAVHHLLVVRVFAANADRDEFRRWLDEEHSRLQVSLPGVNWFLGYEQSGRDHSFLNLWSVDDPVVVHSEAWSRVRDTPWWSRVAHVPANADRGIYRRLTGPVS